MGRWLIAAIAATVLLTPLLAYGQGETRCLSKEQLATLKSYNDKALETYGYQNLRSGVVEYERLGARMMEAAKAVQECQKEQTVLDKVLETCASEIRVYEWAAQIVESQGKYVHTLGDLITSALRLNRSMFPTCR